MAQCLHEEPSQPRADRCFIAPFHSTIIVLINHSQFNYITVFRLDQHFNMLISFSLSQHGMSIEFILTSGSSLIVGYLDEE